MRMQLQAKEEAIAAAGIQAEQAEAGHASAIKALEEKLADAQKEAEAVVAAGAAAGALTAVAGAAAASGSVEADPQNKSPSPDVPASPDGEKLKQ